VNGTVQEEAGRRHTQHQQGYQQAYQRTYTSNSKSYGVGLFSMFIILANLAYAGMRAQDLKETQYWRLLAMIGGFPGTIVSWFAVEEGSGNMYGIKLPVPVPVSNKSSVSTNSNTNTIQQQQQQQQINELLQQQQVLQERIGALESKIQDVL